MNTAIGQARKEKDIVKLIRKGFTARQGKSMPIRRKKSVFDLRERIGGAEGI